LALNPSVDAEWRVPQIQFEEKNEIQGERRWAGGKGINVARWLRHLGSPVHLLLPLGGPTGAEIRASLAAERLETTVVPIRGNSRVNVIVTPPKGPQMRFNALPPALSPPEWRRVVSAVRRGLGRASLLVLSGSLPRGVPVDAYARLIRLAHEADVPCILDCEGAALAAAAAARPLLVKPNHAELQAWSGRALATESDMIAAARRLRKLTGGWVMLSGGHRGAWLVGPREQETWCARPQRLAPRNTVGAGDAMVAATVRCIIAGASPASWIQTAVAVATASTAVPAGVLPEKPLIRRVSKAVRVTFLGG
jgi:tagatose 6-phosphate kinase